MLNHIAIMGRLVANPEVRQTQSGVSVASFTVACESDYKNDNGERETYFIDCVAWRGTADFIGKFFEKGRMIVVDGKLQTRTWRDKEGNNRKSVEIVVTSAYFGDSKKDVFEQVGAKQSASVQYQDPRYVQQDAPSYQQDSFVEITADENDLPF